MSRYSIGLVAVAAAAMLVGSAPVAPADKHLNPSTGTIAAVQPDQMVLSQLCKGDTWDYLVAADAVTLDGRPCGLKDLAAKTGCKVVVQWTESNGQLQATRVQAFSK
jgi:hypothetical protein